MLGNKDIKELDPDADQGGRAEVIQWFHEQEELQENKAGGSQRKSEGTKQQNPINK